MSTYLKFGQRILYAMLVRAWIGAGYASRLLIPNSKVSLKGITTLVFNRSDRLGDAVITLPFLIAAISHLRDIDWQGEVIVIASPLNEPILTPLREISGVELIIHQTAQSHEYGRSIFMVIWHFIIFTQTHLSRVFNRTRDTTLLVDFVDSISELSPSLYTKYPNAQWISASRGIFNPFFDYTLPERFSGNTQIQLIESCINLLEGALGLIQLRYHVQGAVEVFYPPHLPVIRNAILLFVGVKQHRNFNSSVWESFIEQVSIVFPTWDIDILDESSKGTIKQFTKRDWPANINWIENTFSITELPELASKYQLVVGIDGGGINIMRSHTNSLTIFTFGNGVVWGPYWLGKTPEPIQLGSNWLLNIASVRNNRFASSIYKKSIWLPAFQIPLTKKLVDDFPITELLNILKSRLPYTN